MRVRADLTIALRTDSKPLFFLHDISWDPYIANAQNNPQHNHSLPKQFSGLDIKLRYIWANLREFTRSANLAFQTGQKMDCVLFQEILISIQYRLLLLDVRTESLDEVLHVGMLTFATNIFLQMQGLAMRFGNLSARLRDSILGLQGLQDEGMMDFKLWLLFVARLSILAEDEDCWLLPEMRKTVESSELSSWKTARERLKAYLWIDALHDDGGKKALEDATTSLS